MSRITQAGNESAPSLTWRDEYSVGIQEIDNQHKSLLSCFAAIETAIGRGDSWSGVHYAIVELQNLARFHFDFEEALMRLHGFEGAACHQEAHRYFFRRLEALEHQALRAEAENPVIEFLRDWLTKHVMIADKDYARHILEGAPVIGAAHFRPSADGTMLSGDDTVAPAIR